MENRKQEISHRLAALAQTEKLIQIFRDNIDSNKHSTDVIEEMKTQSEFIYDQQAKIDDITAQITQLTDAVEVLSKKVTDAAWAREKDIQSLKHSIEDRLKREGNMVRESKIEGITNCSPSESLTSCMKQKETFLVRSYFEEQNISADVSSSHVYMATMDLTGQVHYGINVQYTVPYSPATNRSLNYALGIKSIAFSLSSNVDASYFVDGRKVGDGKDVKIVGEYFGNRVIEAHFAGQRQSSIENIVENGTYYYPFNTGK